MARAKKKEDQKYYEGCDHAYEAAENAGRGFKAVVLGRPPKYKTAGELAEAVADYFHWNKTHPLRVAEAKSFKDESWDHFKTVRRIKTIGQLCIFIGINESTWRGWRDPEGPAHRPEFSSIIHRAERMIREDKVEGAASGEYHATITSRLLGLSEQVDVKSSVTVKMEAEDSGL